MTIIPREHDELPHRTAVLGYQRSRAALGDAPEVQSIAAALEMYAIRHPRAGIQIPGTIVRVLRASRYGPFPPLRLFYVIAVRRRGSRAGSAAGAVVHLLRIEHYDEMEP